MCQLGSTSQAASSREYDSPGHFHGHCSCKKILEPERKILVALHTPALNAVRRVRYDGENCGDRVRAQLPGRTVAWLSALMRRAYACAYRDVDVLSAAVQRCHRMPCLFQSILSDPGRGPLHLHLISRGRCVDELSSAELAPLTAGNPETWCCAAPNQA